MAVRLKFVGSGGGVVGIPARDLTNDDLVDPQITAVIAKEGGVERLVEVGLYEVVKPCQTRAAAPAITKVGPKPKSKSSRKVRSR